MVKNSVIIFLIFIRHGINPFKPIGKILNIIDKRLTNKEKLFLIKCSKNQILKRVLCENLSFD